MKITEVTACTAGIAHTYTVKEKPEQAVRKLGYTCRIGTRGSIGIEEQLTPEEVQEADVVILAIDVKMSGENRFRGKPVVHISTEETMKDMGAMLQSIEEALAKKKSGEN